MPHFAHVRGFGCWNKGVLKSRLPVVTVDRVQPGWKETGAFGEQLDKKKLLLPGNVWCSAATDTRVVLVGSVSRTTTSGTGNF